MVEYLATLTCARVILAHRGWAVLNFIGAGLAGLMLLAGLGWFIKATVPVAPVIIGYQQEVTREGGVLFTLHMRAPPPKYCAYQTAFFIYSDDSKLNQHNEFYLMGGATTDGSSSFASAEFTVRFFIPSGLPSGRWWFVRRARFWCEPLGLVPHWQQTEPIPVDLP